MHLFFCQQEHCQRDYSGSKPACLTMSTKRNVVPHYLSRKINQAPHYVLKKKIRTFFQEIMMLLRCFLSLKKNKQQQHRKK